MSSDNVAVTIKLSDKGDGDTICRKYDKAYRNNQRSRGREGTRRYNFGRRGVKREFTEATRETGKRNKLDIGNRLKESDIGITEYIGDHFGFSAIIKERYTDFHVNEIDLDGQIAKLAHQDIPCEPHDNENIEDLKKLLPSTIWDQLQTLKEKNQDMEIDVTNLDKAERTVIHTIAKKVANVISQTVDKDGKKFITIVCNTNRKKGGSRQRNDNRVDWKKRGGDYCHFLLHKVNMDTIDALNQLAMSLRIRPDNFSYAGTKDRRAWTTQWVSLRKVDPCNILRAGKTIRGAYIGNFKYAKDALKLGMLRGNQFRIALRNATGTNEEIERAMISLRDNGFINYYGLQRFGTVATIPTHEIGKCLLQGKWHEAIELILKPRPEERDRELAEARQVYAETKDAYAACQKIKRIDKIEARLLEGLQASGDKNPLGALDYIPRNIRLMYIHAYQSFVWNHIVSKRIKQFGRSVIVGDIVFDDQNDQTNIINETTDCFMDDADDCSYTTISSEEKNVLSSMSNENEENSQQIKLNKIADLTEERQKGECGLPAVKFLTEQDLPNYTLTDVLMPQPGWKVIYPPYAKPWFDEFLSQDGLNTDLKQNNKKYSLGGAYRKILETPTNLSWKIVHYNEKHDNLIMPDIDEMRKLDPPHNAPEGEHKALIIEMCLKSSNYATMALREILKSDTSAETQVALSISHDIEGTQSDVAIKKCSKDDYVGKDNTNKCDVKFEPDEQATITKTESNVN